MKIITVWPIRTIIDHPKALEIKKKVFNSMGDKDLTQISKDYGISIKAIQEPNNKPYLKIS